MLRLLFQFSNFFDFLVFNCNNLVSFIFILYIEDLIFIPKDRNGVAINPPPTNDAANPNNSKIYDIRAVEISLTTRSVKDFYNTTTKADGSSRTIVDFESDIEEEINDLFLRETFVMSVNTRNVGLE